MVGRVTSTMCIIQLCLPCPKAAISAFMFKFFILPVSTYNYNYSFTHKNIEEKSISVLQQSLSVEVRRSKATMIGHKGHKEAKTRLCTLSCRLYRYLLDCKVGLLACVHCKSVKHQALGKLGVHQAWKCWCTTELWDLSISIRACTELGPPPLICSALSQKQPCANFDGPGYSAV